MKKPAFLLVCAVAGVAARPGLAETVQITASKDNTLYESEEGDTSNGVGDFFFAGVTDLGSRRRGLLEFDLAGVIPADVRVTGVELRMEVSRETSGSQVFSLHRALAEWGEGASDATGREGFGADAAPGDATWLHTFFDTAWWNRQGGDFAATPAADIVLDAVGPYTWGSTPLMVSQVQRWLDHPDRNHGWVLVGNEQESHTTKRFSSREADNEEDRPTLIVTYEVPEPGSAALLAAMTLMIRRRPRTGWKPVPHV